MLSAPKEAQKVRILHFLEPGELTRQPKAPSARQIPPHPPMKTQTAALVASPLVGSTVIFLEV
jgi:hypothetical protein